MNGYVDLHIHTTASDGTMTPAELIEEIKEKSVILFAITDHDSIENVVDMCQVALENSIDYIYGVEISVSFGEQELHVLTYGFDPNDAVLINILKNNQKIRDDHNAALIRFACEKHPQISYDAYEQYIRDPRLGGWKAENYLFENGITKTLNDFFELVNEMNIPLIFESYDSIIPKLNALGYTLVLAHPTAYFKGKRLETEFLDRLMQLGIDGIECYSPYHKIIEDQKFYIDYCNNSHLLITSGSDYHGQFILTRHLAHPKVPPHDLSYERLLKLTHNTKL